jgi:hypothetical protein
MATQQQLWDDVSQLVREQVVAKRRARGSKKSAQRRRQPQKQRAKGGGTGVEGGRGGDSPAEVEGSAEASHCVEEEEDRDIRECSISLEGQEGPSDVEGDRGGDSPAEVDGPATGASDGVEEEADDDLWECSICLEGQEEEDEPLRQLPACGHSFHKMCIQQWLETAAAKRLQPGCPYCRTPLAPQEIERVK